MKRVRLRNTGGRLLRKRRLYKKWIKHAQEWLDYVFSCGECD